MEIEGIVQNVLPPVKGTSARGEWTKQEVILEQPGEFNRKVCVSFWGDKALDAAALKPGEKISVSVNVESREHNGRWYTEIRAWKMTRGQAPQAGGYAPQPGYAPMAPEPAAPASFSGGGSAEEGSYDDLPF